MAHSKVHSADSKTLHTQVFHAPFWKRSRYKVTAGQFCDNIYWELSLANDCSTLDQIYIYIKEIIHSKLLPPHSRIDKHVATLAERSISNTYEFFFGASSEGTDFAFSRVETARGFVCLMCWQDFVVKLIYWLASKFFRHHSRGERNEWAISINL